MRFYKITLSLFFLYVILLTPLKGLSQNEFQLGSSQEFKVSGTSTLHDWDMLSESGSGYAEMVIEEGQIKEITVLRVDLPVKSLKSGNNRMDRTAYNAMDADKHSSVKFELTRVRSISDGYITATGNLTVAGTRKPVTLRTQYRVNGNSVQFVGNQDIKFSQFDVDPPTALLGSVRTGDDLNISFDVNFNSSSTAK